MRKHAHELCVNIEAAAQNGVENGEHKYREYYADVAEQIAGTGILSRYKLLAVVYTMAQVLVKIPHADTHSGTP